MTSRAPAGQTAGGAADEIDAGGDHRGGVDECGDGRRAFHRVRQPGVQRELGRLADAAEEEAEAKDDVESWGGRHGIQPDLGLYQLEEVDNDVRVWKNSIAS